MGRLRWFFVQFWRFLGRFFHKFFEGVSGFFSTVKCSFFKVDDYPYNIVLNMTLIKQSCTNLTAVDWMVYFAL